jgi:integration host factor subunit beta
MNQGHNMTKSDLISQVANRNRHLTVKEIEIITNQIFDSMMDTLARGDRIELRGFGSFSVKQREARTGRNPKTGEAVQIPAKRVPFFKTGKPLQELINREKV